VPVPDAGYRSHGGGREYLSGTTDDRRIAVIDAFLQVLVTDPTQAGIIFAAATVGTAFFVSGALATLAAIERRLAVIFRQRPRPLPLHGPVRPFMRKVLESRDPEVVGTPVTRPRPYRLVLVIVVVVTVVVSTGYRIGTLLPSLPVGATPIPTVRFPAP
jgi:hypothetical protein